MDMILSLQRITYTGFSTQAAADSTESNCCASTFSAGGCTNEEEQLQ